MASLTTVIVNQRFRDHGIPSIQNCKLFYGFVYRS